jgi:hypothetical protein
LGENFLYPTTTRKARKDRTTHESSTSVRRRDSHQITSESRKRSTPTTSSLLTQRRRTLETEIQKPLDKSRETQTHPTSTNKLKLGGKKTQLPPLFQTLANNLILLIKSKKRPSITSITYISNQAMKEQMKKF